MNGQARRLISKNLRKLRSERGMTQEDLAAAADIDRSYISELENEKFAASVDLLEKLADVFGLEVFQMLHPDTGEAPAK